MRANRQDAWRRLIVDVYGQEGAANPIITCEQSTRRTRRPVRRFGRGVEKFAATGQVLPRRLTRRLSYLTRQRQSKRGSRDTVTRLTCSTVIRTRSTLSLRLGTVRDLSVSARYQDALDRPAPSLEFVPALEMLANLVDKRTPQSQSSTWACDSSQHLVYQVGFISSCLLTECCDREQKPS